MSLRSNFIPWRRELATRQDVAAVRKNIKLRLRRISELRPAVDMFFDKVHVMAEDPEVRKESPGAARWLA